MKRVLSDFIKTIIAAGIAFMLLLLFSGCENYLIKQYKPISLKNDRGDKNNTPNI